MELYHSHGLPRASRPPSAAFCRWDDRIAARGAGARSSLAWRDGITATARALAITLGWRISLRLLTSDRELTEDRGDIWLCGVNVELLVVEAVPATSWC